jgi:hypothetical protein
MGLNRPLPVRPLRGWIDLDDVSGGVAPGYHMHPFQG